MSDQEYLEPDGGFPEEEFIDEADIASILQEYHRKQLLENLTGPAVSLLVHVLVLTLMFVYVVSRPKTEPPAIEVSIVEEEIKEIEPEVLEEIDPEIEETTTDEAPTPEVSDAPTEEIGTDNSPVDVSDEAPETDDNMDTSDVLDVVATNSPLTLSDLYGGRSNAGRGDAVRKYGGGRPGQNAVNKALRWLAKVQNDDGSWGTSGQKSAYSGMALLVFLAHGETPLSEQYGTTVQKAMKWLANAAQQSPMGRAYSHGIATYALAEAYGMTRIPFMRDAMEQAVGVIIYGQQNGGGFDYNYKKGARWDLSVAGWQFQALKAAYVAGASNDGLEEAIRKSIKFCRQTAYRNNRFGYTKPGAGSKNMTGVGTVALQLLGEGKCAEAKGALEFISTDRFEQYQKVATDPGEWDKIAGHCLYGWYYDTQAMFNAQFDAQGKKRWKQWRPIFEKVLVDHQQPEGYWEVKKGHGMGANLNGQILATCWAALQLEVYYRYLPTFDIKKMDKHQLEDANLEEAGGGDGGGDLIIEIE